jgi:hypothetical protein
MLEGIMKRLYKSWVFAFLLSIFLLLLLFYYGLYKLEASPPSKEWSRGINISEVNKNQVKNLDHVNVITILLPEDKSFITFWEIDNSLYYSIISKMGTTLHKGKINYIFPEFNQLGAVLRNGSINIIGTSEKKLNNYVFDYKKNIIRSCKVLDKNVNNFITQANYVVYSTDKVVKLIDSHDKLSIVNNVTAKLLNGVKAEDGLFYILITTENDNFNIYLNYAAYNEETGKLMLYKGLVLPVEHNCELINSSFGIDEKNKSISLLEVIRQWETQYTTALNITFPIGNTNNPDIKFITLGSYNPNPLMLKYSNNTIEFIATSEYKTGVNKSAFNLQLYTVRKGDILEKKSLTKTKYLSTNPQLINIDKDSYLIWKDMGSNSVNINFASTNKIVYGKAGQLNIMEYINLIFKMLIGAFSGLLLVLLLSVVIVLPTALVIFLISTLALTWSENNSKKIINLGIILQLLYNIGFTLYLNNVIKQLKEFLPTVLQSTTSILILVIITTSIAAFCTKRKFHHSYKISSVLRQYLFFAIINTILYSLIFFPYYWI